MSCNPTEISIDGVVYVRQDSIAQPADTLNGLPYCCVRTRNAGVFLGYIDPKSIDGTVGIVRNARRVWVWAGAASLSELAQRGTSKPESCKWPMPVSEVYLTQIVEVIPCTQAAKKTHDEVKTWTA